MGFISLSEVHTCSVLVGSQRSRSCTCRMRWKIHFRGIIHRVQLRGIGESEGPDLWIGPVSLVRGPPPACAIASYRMEQVKVDCPP